MMRYVRYAAAALFALLAVATAGMWARSHWWIDNLVGPSKGAFRPGVASAEGRLTLRYRNGKMDPEAFPKWTLQTTSAEAREQTYKQMEDSIKGTNATFARPTFALGWKDDWGLQFPHWLAMVLTSALAVVAGWKLQWRFTLRSLLVATAVIAALLALAAWAF